MRRIHRMLREKKCESNWREKDRLAVYEPNKCFLFFFLIKKEKFLPLPLPSLPSVLFFSLLPFPFFSLPISALDGSSIHKGWIHNNSRKRLQWSSAASELWDYCFLLDSRAVLMEWVQRQSIRINESLVFDLR